MPFFYWVFNIDKHIADQFHNRMDLHGTDDVEYVGFSEYRAG